MNHSVFSLSGDEGTRQKWTHALQSAGFRVFEASDWEGAVRVALAQSPDAVVVAASHLGVSVQEILSRLCAAAGTAPVVVCAIPRAGSGWEADALRAGATACLPAQPTPELLVSHSSRESQALLSAFFNSPGAKRGIVEVAADADVRHVADNEVTRSFAGIDDMTGKLGSELGEPRDILKLWVSNYRRSRETNAPVSFEYLDDRAGTGRWVSSVVCYVGTTPQGTERFSYVATDITDRKRAEEALEKATNILAEGQRIAHVGTFEYVVDTRTTMWSEEEYRIYGLDPASPSPVYDVMLARSIHPDDADLLHRTFTAAIESRTIYELEHRKHAEEALRKAPRDAFRRSLITRQ